MLILKKDNLEFDLVEDDEKIAENKQVFFDVKFKYILGSEQLEDNTWKIARFSRLLVFGKIMFQSWLGNNLYL